MRAQHARRLTAEQMHLAPDRGREQGGLRVDRDALDPLALERRDLLDRLTLRAAEPAVVAAAEKATRWMGRQAQDRAAMRRDHARRRFRCGIDQHEAAAAER